MADLRIPLAEFPAGVAEKLNYYVYRLIDPRNGETFYIGKGNGNRLFRHVNATKVDDLNPETDGQPNEEGGERDTEENLKVRRINEIRRDNLEVVHVVHRHGIEDERTAYEVEAALIDAFSGLSNLSAGHGSNDRGPMHVHQILDKYALPEADLSKHKLMLININSAEHNSDDELYDRTRYAWRVSKCRAERVDYVLAVIHGVIRGAFIAEEWLDATPQNFPGFVAAISPRIGFRGRRADEVWDHYVGERGKRIPDDMRPKGQNPIRYVNC